MKRVTYFNLRETEKVLVSKNDLSLEKIITTGYGISMKHVALRDTSRIKKRKLCTIDLS